MPETAPPKIDDLLTGEAIEKATDRVVGLLDKEILNYQSLIELGIIVIGFFAALYVSKNLRAYISGWEVSYTSRTRRYLFATLRRLIFPLLMFAWVGLFTVIYIVLKHPWPLLSTAMSLTVAWFVIRLGSSFIDNPLISRAVAAVIWVIAALNILGYLSPVVEFLDKTKINAGQASISLYAIVSSLLSIAIFLWIAFALIKLVDNILRGSSNITPSARALLSKTFKFALVAAAFIFGLSTVGIDLTAFAVLGGAIGVGIGFGLQKIFSNLISGFILLLDKSIKPGDTINVEGSYGRVDTLSARYVSVITRDGIEHLVPNEEMIINRVENWSYSHENVRLRIPVGVHYKTDVNKAIELCLDAAGEVDRVLNMPKPACLLKGFGDNSVDLEIRIWVRDPMNGCSNVKSQVLLVLWNKFHEHKIEIPYPQRDLHLRSISGELMSLLKPTIK
ncbi:MAG: mechanosensitive ion channel family protein [Gammaproteobacteria bacterium]